MAFDLRSVQGMCRQVMPAVLETLLQQFIRRGQVDPDEDHSAVLIRRAFESALLDPASGDPRLQPEWLTACQRAAGRDSEW